MSKIQTFIKKKNQSYNLILEYQFLSLKWTKKSKTNVNYGTPHQKKITIIEQKSLI